MDNTYLTHHGIKGMKWGVRRYETSSGHLTAAGKKRYGDGPVGKAKAASKQAKKNVKSSPAKNKEAVKADRATKNVKNRKKGQQKTKQVMAKAGKKSVKAVGSSAKMGASVVKSLYNISDTGQRMNQTQSYVNLASQMSPEYRMRYMY